MPAFAAAVDSRVAPAHPAAASTTKTLPSLTDVTSLRRDMSRAPRALARLHGSRTVHQWPVPADHDSGTPGPTALERYATSRHAAPQLAPSLSAEVTGRARSPLPSRAPRSPRASGIR